MPGCPTGALHYVILAISILRQRSRKQSTSLQILDHMIFQFARLSLRWWSQNSVYFGAGFHDLVEAEVQRRRGKISEALKRYSVALDKFASAEKYYWIAFTHETLRE
jgi:hypothetical protein